MANLWSLRNATRNLPQLIKLALNGVPQTIMLPGQRAVVVLPVEEYLQLKAQERGIVSFFRESPLGEVVRAGDITFIRELGDIHEVSF